VCGLAPLLGVSDINCDEWTGDLPDPVVFGTEILPMLGEQAALSPSAKDV